VLFNTFVDADRHEAFDSNTDLAFPPDLKHFLNYVGETVHAGIAYSSDQDGTAGRSDWAAMRLNPKRSCRPMIIVICAAAR
jgi:hypothetical protein